MCKQRRDDVSIKGTKYSCAWTNDMSRICTWMPLRNRWWLHWNWWMKFKQQIHAHAIETDNPSIANKCKLNIDSALTTNNSQLSTNKTCIISMSLIMSCVQCKRECIYDERIVTNGSIDGDPAPVWTTRNMIIFVDELMSVLVDKSCQRYKPDNEYKHAVFEWNRYIFVTSI